MQEFGSGSMVCENSAAYFGRSDAFVVDDIADQSDSGGCFSGCNDTIERQLKASSFSLGDIGTVHISEEAAADDLRQQLEFQIDDNSQLLQDMLQQQHNIPGQQQSDAAASWEESIHVLQEMLLLQQRQAFHSQDNVPCNLTSSGSVADRNNVSNLPVTKFPGESELLSLLQFSRCAASSLPATFSAPTAILKKPIGSIGVLPLYNSDQHLQYDSNYESIVPEQSYPTPFGNGMYNLAPVYNLSSKPLNHQQLHAEEKDTNLNDEGRQFTSSQFDFRRDNTSAKPGEQSRGINHFATERQRREYLNEKYQTLRSLVPNPTKADRASIVQDAIEYVKELKRTVQELQILVQEKRRGGLKKRKLDDGVTDMESSSQPTLQRGQDIVSDGCQLRSSWLQRTSHHGTQVDVRIVDDEVNIKLTQKRRRNILLNVVIMLHELRLDILHANGASIGEHHIYMFNAKMIDGSSTYAGHIVAKLIEAVDRHFSTYCHPDKIAAFPSC